MATTENNFFGDGTTTNYSFTFEYIEQSDVKASINETETTDFTFANATTLSFNTAPTNGARIRIFRDTDIDTLKATFFAGSAIKAEDLNNNFTQNNFTVQEIKNNTWDNELDTIHSDETWESADTQIATTAAIDARFHDVETDTVTNQETWDSSDSKIATTAAIDARFHDNQDDTIRSDESWVSNDVKIATTEAIDDRFFDGVSETVYSTDSWASGVSDQKIATSHAIDKEIKRSIEQNITGVQGIDVRQTSPGDGDITIGIEQGGIDYIELAGNAIINSTESKDDIRYQANQASGQSNNLSDQNILTAAASEHRYRNYHQQITPQTGNAEFPTVGTLWLRPGTDPNDPNSARKTLSMWDGNSWDVVSSGGSFTNQQTTIYVDHYSGDDVNNDGRRIINQVKTIKRALELAQDGDYITIAPGVYQEELPLDITQKNLSIVGDSIRSVFIQPLSYCESSMKDPLETLEGSQTANVDNAPNPDYWDPDDTNQQNEVDAVMFRLNSGTYIANMTFVGMQARSGGRLHPIDQADGNNLTGLSAYQGWVFGLLPGAKIKKSPYIQNCTNFTDSGIVNSNYPQDDGPNYPDVGDPAVHATYPHGVWDGVFAYNPTTVNDGAAGDTTSAVLTGGGIIIDGAKPAFTSPLRSMVADSFTQVGLNGPGIFVTNNGYTQLTSSYSFFGHYHLKAHNGGQANLAASTTDFGNFALVADGKSPNPIFTAETRGAHNLKDTVVEIDGITPFIFGGGATGTPATNMIAEIGGTDYPILNWDPGNSEITIFRPKLDANGDVDDASANEGLDANVANDTTVNFYFRSLVASSGHTMEYAGSGTNYNALPENGGVPNDDKQITESNGGKVWAVIVDHNGKLKAGDFEVDQQSGSVSLPAGGLGVPLLIEDLDTSTHNISSSDTNGIQITSEVDLNTNKITNLGGTLNNDPDHYAASKGYVDAKAAVNATDIATNASNISSNFSAINTLSSAVTTNVSSISTNAADIATNATNIATNTTNIATNATDIAGKLSLSGGTMTGPINMDRQDIEEVQDLGVAGNLTVAGNLNVTGTTTTVNSQTLSVSDKNVELATTTNAIVFNATATSGSDVLTVNTNAVNVPSSNVVIVGPSSLIANGRAEIVSKATSNNVTTITIAVNAVGSGSGDFTVYSGLDADADGGGITLRSETDKTFNWINSTDSWTSSENIDLASGKDFKIAGSSVLSGTTLGSGVTSSSLTSVGTIGTGTWNGTTIGVDYGGTGQTSYTDGQLLIGNSTGNTLTKATLTGGNGVTVTNGNGSINLDVDLKANGGLVIESTELALDLGASAITGTLGTGDGGTGITTAPSQTQVLVGNSSNGYDLRTVVAGTNTAVDTSTAGEIAINSTDTTYTAGDGLTLSSTEFSVNLNGSNSGLEFIGGKLQADDSIARATGDTFTGACTFNDTLFLGQNTSNILSTLAFKELSGSNYVGFKAPNAIATDIVWTLPDADGTPGQFLSTDGNQTLGWMDPSAAVGNGTDQVFFENDQTINTAYTITAGKNAMSAGPITVQPGATPTIPSGSTWTVV